jgi:NTP pyrophosphatase (non-canonical NTP hydrolase)
MPASDELQFAMQNRAARLEAELTAENLDHLGRDIHKVNVDKGFWGEPVLMDKWQAKLMLVVTEVAEITEALRKSQGKDKVTEEFADLFIRSLDIFDVLVNAGEADPLLYKVILDKVETNKNRPPKHGNRWG